MTAQTARTAKDTKILVIDDEDMNIIVLTKVLMRNGYEVISAKNGREGIAKATLPPQPDIILMDLMMPEINGWDATKSLKTNSQTMHIPIFAVTALTTEHQAAIEFGFDGFCEKPIDFNLLIDLLENIRKKTGNTKLPK